MQPDIALAPADRVIAILNALRKAGLDPDAVLRKAEIPLGLEDLHGDEGDSLSMAACTTAVHAALDLVEREAARRNGVPPPPAHLQLMMSRSAMSCATLGNILGNLQLLSEVLNGAGGLGAVQIEYDETRATLSSPRYRRDPVSFLADFFLSISMRNMLSWMIRRNLPLRALLLPYPQSFAELIPPGFIDCKLLWGQPQLAFCYAASLHQCRVARTEDDLAELQKIAPLLLDEIGELGPFTTKVGRLLDGRCCCYAATPFPRSQCVWDIRMRRPSVALSGSGRENHRPASVALPSGLAVARPPRVEKPNAAWELERR